MESHLVSRFATPLMRRIAYILPAVIVAVVVVAVSAVVERVNDIQSDIELRAAVSSTLGTLRARVEGTINANAYLVRGMVTAIAVEPDLTQERFTALASNLFRANSQLRHIGAAPDMVVRFVYPKKGNEAAIGLDYRTNEAQRDAAGRARDADELVVAGPVDLVQGGQGFVGRIPVFTGPPGSQSRRFWGVISAVIDVDRFYDASGLTDPTLPFEVAVRGKDALGAKGAVFFGREAVFRSDPILADVALPYGSWQMAAIPKGGWPSAAADAWSVRILCFVVGVFLVGATVVASHLVKQRQASERAVRQSETRLRSILDAAPYGIFLKDRERRYVVANAAYCRIYGVAAERVVGHVAEDFQPESFTRRAEVEERRILDEGLPIYDEFALTLPTGAVRHMAVTKFPVFGDDDAVVGLGAIMVDTTERRNAEAELLESRNRYSALVEQAPVGILVHQDDRFVFANEAYARMLGVDDPARLIGTDIWRTVAESEWSRIRGVAEHRLATGDVIPTETRHLRVDGREIDVRIVGRPVVFDGRPATQVVCEDITESKRLEERLRQSQKMEAVGQLTGGVAHDFNNLLQVIETNLEFARANIPEGSQVLDLLDAALRAGRRGAGLTQKLLAFSRKQTLRPVRVRVADWADGEARLLARTLGEDITIEVDVREGVGTVFVDEGGLTNALLNLALNARAAMPNGGNLTISAVRVTVAPGRTPVDDAMAPGEYVEIAVRDTGSGMDQDVMVRAFEPFFSTKEVGQGSGLGLSMVYGFARQSGGAAIIESVPGEGTTVRILLPAIHEPFAAAEPPSPDVPRTPLAVKVLLVEDDADVRASTAMLLESFGCTVVEASDAALAMASLEKDAEIRVLLSDVVLPGGENGIELAREAICRYSDLKVILVSGYPESALKKVGVSESKFLLLGKPYSKEQLMDALGVVMESGKG